MFESAVGARRALPCDPQATLTDPTGRAAIYRGLNLSYRTPNREMHLLGGGGYSPPITRDELVSLRRDAGFNQMRLLVTWSEIEPEKGRYNEAYIAEIREFLDLAATARMKVIVDFHQGLYGVFTEKNATGLTHRLGNGAPAWAVITDGLKVDLQQPWPYNYSDPGVERAFDNFYDYRRHPDLQDHFIAAAARVAGALKGHPALLGYDIMNEPWPGSKPHETSEETKLHPFYVRFIARVRAVDPDAWIFYEPTAITVNPGGKTRLPRLDDPRPGGRRLVYTPHFYPIPELASLPYWRPVSGVDSFRANAIRDRARLESPLLVDEFRIKDTFPGWRNLFQDALSIFDETGSGWSYWAWMKGSVVEKRLKEDPPLAAKAPLIAPDGREQGHTWEFLVRPYPLAMAGALVENKYQPRSRRLIVRYVTRPNVDGPTEIFIPERTYPQGWTVRTTGTDGRRRVEFDRTWNTLRVWLDDGAEHLIVIEPRT